MSAAVPLLLPVVPSFDVGCRSFSPPSLVLSSGLQPGGISVSGNVWNFSSLREAIRRPKTQMWIEKGEFEEALKWYWPAGQPSNRPTALSFSTLRSSSSLSLSLCRRPFDLLPASRRPSFRPSFSERFSLRRRGRWMDLRSLRLSQLLALLLPLSLLRDCPEPSEIAHGMCHQKCICRDELCKRRRVSRSQSEALEQ